MNLQPNNRVGFFDLETQYLFNEVDPSWNDLSWREKKDEREEVKKELRVAIAGLLTAEDVFRSYVESDMMELFNDLISLDLILGHNILAFDYFVLSRYLSADQIEELKSKTIDTLVEIEKITGVWTKLDDLGKLNLGIQKLENSLEIPKLWRDGEYDRVERYLKRDLDLLRGIFTKVRRVGKLKYLHKEYGEVKGMRIIDIHW